MSGNYVHGRKMYIYIFFFIIIIVIYNIVGERKSDMLLCVMLNGPKKVGLPRMYKSILYGLYVRRGQ